MIKRLEDLAFNVLAVVDITAHLVVLAPFGLVIVSIDVAAELQRRGRAELKRRFG